MQTKRVMIVAGEASGEQRAAGLVREVARLTPDVHFYGIGGPQMRAAGVETLIDSADMAVLGLVEVLAHYPRLRRTLNLMRTRIEQDRPDLLILVDYSGFNLRLAPTAKALGIPVLYYISPQVWAWRQKRVFKIKQVVDMMAVVFPFELPFYEAAGVPVRFVGHPLVDEVHCDLDVAAARALLGLDPEQPVVGLFPGSRRGELKRLLPTLLDAAEQLRARDPRIQFVLPRAAILSEADLAPYLIGRDLPLTVVGGHPYETMRACDAIAAASGTVTLEIALMQVPLVVLYRVAPLSYRIMRRLIRVPHIAICNIVAGERIAPELIQDDATPRAVAAELWSLLNDRECAEEMRRKFATVREKLGGPGGSEKVARLALEMLGL